LKHSYQALKTKSAAVMAGICLIKRIVL